MTAFVRDSFTISLQRDRILYINDERYLVQFSDDASNMNMLCSHQYKC